MQACATADEVREAFARVAALAESNFGSAGVFLERLVRPARHVEVQIFGDGTGRIAVIGDRDSARCSARNQKVIEEAPPRPCPAVSAHCCTTPRAGCSPRSATAARGPWSSSTTRCARGRLPRGQHPAPGRAPGDRGGVRRRPRRTHARPGPRRPGRQAVFDREWTPTGHAVEARVYAEDPGKDSLPSSGLVTRAVLPGQGTDEMPGVRVDGFAETGSEISPYYDPMLAKVIAHGATRDTAFDLLGKALAASRVDGIVTNLGLLRSLTVRDEVRKAVHSTSTLATTADPEPRIDVLVPGAMTTVQDLPAGSATGTWACRRAAPSTRLLRRGQPGRRQSGRGTRARGHRGRPDPALFGRHRGRRHRRPRPDHCGRHRGGPVGAGAGPGRRHPGPRRVPRARPAQLRVRPGRHRRTRIPGQRLDLHPRRLRRPRRPGTARRRRTSARNCQNRYRRPDPARAPSRDHPALADRCHRRTARGTRVLHPRGHRHPLRHRLQGAPQLGPHRHPPDRTQTAMGPPGRRRGRSAPLQHPRHAVRRGRPRLHRRHTDRPGPRRTVPRRIRLPRGGRQRRTV